MAVMLAIMPLSGCTAPKEGKNVQDGIYEGLAEGFNGSVIAEVKFQDGKIADINITDEKETATVSDFVLKAVPDAIIANQSWNIDTTSGATATADGVVNAVKDAIQKAGGNLKEWKSENQISLKYSEKKIKTDVVVIGGGVAGLATALRLQQIGVDTTIVEKDDSLGGVLKDVKCATQLVGSYFAEESEDCLEEVKNELLEKNANETLLDILLNRLNETVQWELNTLGVPFAEEYETSNVFTEDSLKQYNASSNTVGELLGKEAEVSGARILFSTAMTDLKENEDGVSVSAKGKDGTTYTISSSYAVLATGGMNDETSDLVTVTSDRSGNDTEKIANLLDLKKTEGNTIPYGLTLMCDENTYVDLYDFLEKNLKNGAFLIDEDGNRFCNEKMNRLDLSEIVCSAGKDVYMVLNEKTYASLKTMLTKDKNVSDEIVEKLGNDALESVICATEEKELPVNLLPAIEQLNDSYLESRENEEYSDSTGRNDFYGELTAEDTYVLVKMSRAQLYSSSSLQTDDKLHAVKEDDTVLEFTYIAGSACGNITESKMVSGVSNAWAFVSGKTVADEISGILAPDALNKILAKETENY